MTVREPKLVARPDAPLRFEYLLKVSSRSAPGAEEAALVDEAYVPVVGEGDLPLLAQLGTEAFGDQGPRRYGMTRLSFYRALYESFGGSFRFVLDPMRMQTPLAIDSDALIGFTCVLPISSRTTDRYLRGELSQFELTADDVRPGGTEIDLWNQAIYLRQRSADWFAMLLHSLACSMADATANDLAAVRRAPRLIAEGTSPHGRQFLTSFGLDEAGPSKDTCPIFIADDREGRSLGQISNRQVLTSLARRYARRNVDRAGDM